MDNERITSPENLVEQCATLHTFLNTEETIRGDSQKVSLHLVL